MFNPKPVRFLALAAAAAALPLWAGAIPSDPLAWVPADATAVGQLNLRDLKNSDLTRDLWRALDDTAADGDAARFLADAGLDPRQDLDALTVAVLAGEKREGGVLVIAEGRFDIDRLTRATLARGGEARASDGRAWIRLPEKNQEAKNADHRAGAVAYLSSRLALAGDETTVAAVLAAPGGGAKLVARHGAPAGATGWFVADTLRLDGRERRTEAAAEGGKGPLAARINFCAGEFTLEKGRLRFAGRVDAPDAQSREDLEEMARGALAAWRMHAQEKQPDLVAVIRGFEVKRDGEGVRVSGVVPGELAKKILDRRPEAKPAGGRSAR